MIIKNNLFGEIKTNRISGIKMIIFVSIFLMLLLSCNDNMENMIRGQGGNELPDVHMTEIVVDTDSLTVKWDVVPEDEVECVKVKCSDGSRVELTSEMEYTFGSLLNNTEYTLSVRVIYSHNRESEGYTINISTGALVTYYTIANGADLDDVRINPGWTYIVIRDIDLSGYSNWDPIGTLGSEFTGKFDGKGHVIKNLVINRNTDNIGLFGYTNGSEISNVKLVNVNVKNTMPNTGALIGSNDGCDVINCSSSGTLLGISSVGGLIGVTENGSIKNCYSTASVSGSGNNIGGLVGNNNSPIEYCYSMGYVSGTKIIGESVGGLVGWNQHGSISNSYSTASVNGYIKAGGLVGLNDTNGTISSSYSTGSVSGSNGVGGFVGANENVIVYSYSTGSVSGSNGVGGFVGANNGPIGYSFSTSSVSGGSDLGGLVGFDNSGSIANSYWNIDVYATSDGGFGLTTIQMKDAANVATNYVDWDFDNVWDIDGTTNGGYPFLR